jgi:hypothetical protein
LVTVSVSVSCLMLADPDRPEAPEFLTAGRSYSGGNRAIRPRHLVDRGAAWTRLASAVAALGVTRDTKGNFGRDHHGGSFSVWLAGGVVRGGLACGETDDFSDNIAGSPPARAARRRSGARPGSI